MASESVSPASPALVSATATSELPFRDWLVFAALASAGAALVVIANPNGKPVQAAIAAAVILLNFGIYWVVARPSLAGVRQDSPRAWTYAALAIVLFTTASLLNPWSGLALFALSPQIFLLLRPPPAALVIVLLNVLPLVGQLVLVGAEPGDLVQSIATTAFIIVFSIFFSSRILLITRQSEERQRLIVELGEREAEVAALSAERGAAAERTRLARELHDTLAQGFTSIITLGHAVQGELDADSGAARRHVALITETAQENLQESRRMIAALSPARLDGTSLPQALARITARFEEETDARTGFSVAGSPIPLSQPAEIVLLRVAQEGLANARRHARAGHVELMLSYAADAVELRVTDDGDGFDPGSSAVGFGLAGMRGRLHEAGGSLEVRSSAGAGTVLVARLPLGAGAS